MLCCNAIQRLVCCCFKRDRASVAHTDDAKLEDLKTTTVALNSILGAVSGKSPGIATDESGKILYLNEPATRALNVREGSDHLNKLTEQTFRDVLHNWVAPFQRTSSVPFKLMTTKIGESKTTRVKTHRYVIQDGPVKYYIFVLDTIKRAPLKATIQPTAHPRIMRASQHFAHLAGNASSVMEAAKQAVKETPDTPHSDALVHSALSFILLNRQALLLEPVRVLKTESTLLADLASEFKKFALDMAELCPKVKLKFQAPFRPTNLELPRHTLLQLLETFITQVFLEKKEGTFSIKFTYNEGKFNFSIETRNDEGIRPARTPSTASEASAPALRLRGYTSSTDIKSEMSGSYSSSIKNQLFELAAITEKVGKLSDGAHLEVNQVDATGEISIALSFSCKKVAPKLPPLKLAGDLPHTDSAASLSGITVEASPIRATPLRVLVVEDEAIPIHILTRYFNTSLPNKGFTSLTVDYCKKGEDAVALYKVNSYDLVSMDIVLTGAMGGVEAARQIHAFDNSAFIVPMSSNNSETDIGAYSAAGMDISLQTSKPMKLDMFIKALDKAIELKQRRGYGEHK